MSAAALRHYLVAALRNLAANRLVSAIAILGLAVGIAAALLMGLVVRNQMSFDDFIPGHARTYLAMSPPDPAVRGDTADLHSEPGMAAWLRLHSPEVESVTRLSEPWQPDLKSLSLKAGNVLGWDSFYWADRNAFEVLPLPVLEGDLATALNRPDGIAMTRSLALKYFGRVDAVGQILTIGGHPMTVRAVLRDLPANGSSLKSGIFASDLAPFAKVARDNRDQDAYVPLVFTYIRLRPGASAASVEGSAAAYFKREGNQPFINSQLVRLDRVNLLEQFNPDIHARLIAAALAGLLVLLTAVVNFINLSLAVSARRQKEVGVRKSCGAGRAALIVQFLGESAIAVIFAGAMAATAGEWLMPALNAFLATGAQFNFGADPLLLPLLLLAALLVVLAAGAWPALVLSAFRPARVMRGAETGGTGPFRNPLTTLQFAILIVLAVAAAVVWQQRDFAAHAAPRANVDQMLVVRIPHGEFCSGAMRDELQKLPGVLAAGCSSRDFLTGGTFTGGSPAWGPFHNFRIGYDWANPGLLALYGIKPVAGSFGPLTAQGNVSESFGVILNESAVHKLGFSSPAASIGQSWMRGVPDNPMTHYMLGSHARIMAVVPDFAFYSVTQPRQATVYSPQAGRTVKGEAYFGGLIFLKLDGRRIPEILAAVDQIWKATGQDGPVNRFFLDDYMQKQYIDMTREAALFSGFTAIAVILACLGLFGIAVSTAERRTKEIGVRKAMGADSGQIVALLLWEFARPVLWANVIAWPLAFWAMQRWLNGFAFHVAIPLWLFPAVGLATLLIALATVAGQAWMTARQKPVLALRYE